MDLEYGERYETFRREVRGFLAKQRPDGRVSLGESGSAFSSWLTLLIEHGYWARTIPKEYGGYGAEPDLLETVMENLLDNALKFTPEGGQVGLELAQNGLTIRDSGPGLDPETARTMLTFALADEVLERFAA